LLTWVRDVPHMLRARRDSLRGCNGDEAVLHLGRDVVDQRDAALAELALGGDRLAGEFDLDACRYGDRVFTDT
jgi:hypothetical protein